MTKSPPSNPNECSDTSVCIEIVDRKTGAVVSGSTVTKIVGQKIELQVRSNPSGHSLTNIQWSIPGATVKTYTQSTSSASKTDLAAADLRRNNVDFYWIAPGNHTVQIAADVQGSRKSASATFDAQAPTGVSFRSVTGTVAVGNPGFPGTGIELHYGTSTTPGITFTGRATAPANGAGKLAVTQLVETVRTLTRNSGVVRTLSSGGASVLDTDVQYARRTRTIASGGSATYTASDTPGNGLSSAYQRMSIADNFKAYFVYRPDGGDSIWVTLMLLEWDWAGTTTRVGAPGGTGNSWNPPTGVSNTANPSGTGSTDLPIWSANVTSLSFSP